MTVHEWWMNSALGNKVIHLSGSRGRWYQDHMLSLFQSYRNEELDESRCFEDANNIFLELKRRKP